MKSIQRLWSVVSLVLVAGCGDPSVGALPSEAPPIPVEPSPRALPSAPPGVAGFQPPPSCVGDCGATAHSHAAPQPAVARPLSPWNGATVARTRPTLRWALSDGARGARAELCRDRSCAAPALALEVPGAELTVPSEIAPGVWFWRLRAFGKDGPAANYSATWSFRVRARDGASEGAFGLLPDVNGDGLSDVVHRWNAIAWHPGRREGLEPRRQGRLTPLGGASEPFAVVGDLDGDGYQDTLQVALGPLRAVVHPGGPEGPSNAHTWTVALPAEEASVTRVLGVGDVHGDGYSDALLGMASGAWLLLRGSRDHGPALQRLPLPEGSRPTEAYPSDYDGDGYADVALGGAGLVLLLGSAGGPLFVTEMPEITCQFGASGGDLDGDGFGDLACLDRVPGGLRYHRFEGRRRGLSRAPTETRVLPVGATPNPSRVDASMAQDLDGDGRSELLVGLGWAESAVTELRLYGGGGVEGRSLLRVPEAPHEIDAVLRAVGDTDGDGRDEVLVTTRDGWRTGGTRVLSQGADGAAALRRLVCEP
ncbi:MAG: hypothetical protein HY909_10245 [Deltaproteobacteria bacterium]|nr:hypothetical protein [Deltaproteobacteria bacterium]